MPSEKNNAPLPPECGVEKKDIMSYNERMITTEIEITNKAEKDLKKAPALIRDKAISWMSEVTINGLQATRQNSGLHDEPLGGERTGERSIRLNRRWRLFYTEKTLNNKTVLLITILEVNTHVYKKRK